MPCALQVALTPVPGAVERYARWLYRSRERTLVRRARPRRAPAAARPLRGRRRPSCAARLDVQHRPLFFAEMRVVGPDRRTLRGGRRGGAAHQRRREPARRARHDRPPGAASPVRPAGDARRGQPAARRGSAASTPPPSCRACGSCRRSTSRPCRSRAARCRARRPSPAIARPPRRRRAAARRARAGDDPPRAAPPEHRGARAPSSRARPRYLVATIREDLRARALRGDRASTPRATPPTRRSASCPPSARARSSTSRDPTCGFNPLAVDARAGHDRRLRRRRRCATSSTRATSAPARTATCATRSSPSLAYDRARDAVGRRAAAVGHRGGLRLPRRASRAHLRGLPEFKEVGDFFAEELARPAARRRAR